jgi:hypothetical protein
MASVCAVLREMGDVEDPRRLEVYLEFVHAPNLVFQLGLPPPEANGLSTAAR